MVNKDSNLHGEIAAWIRNIMDNQKDKTLGLLATVLIVLAYMLVNYNKTMPFAEGWYTYYADLIGKGNVPYVDFEYLFMPLYMYMIYGFIAIFGFKIIALRILGAILFIGISCVLYKIFSEFFGPLASTIAAVTTVLFIQSEVVQIFYDYIRFMDFFAFMAILYLIRLVKELSDDNINMTNAKNGIISGIFTGFVLLTKQNVGILFFVYILLLFVALYFYDINWKKITKASITYFLGAAMVILVLIGFLIFNDASKQFIDFTLFKAVEAKGGTFAVLFNWIIRGIPIFTSQIPVLAILFSYLFINRKYQQKYWVRPSLTFDRCLIIGFTISSILIIVVSYNVASLARLVAATLVSFHYALFLFIVILFLWLLIQFILDFVKKTYLHKKQIPFFTLLGAIISIGYAVGMSGGLSESQTALCLGVFLAIAITNTQHKLQANMKFLIVTISFALSMSFISAKYVNPYTWWGMAEPELWENIECVNVPLLKGIKVSKNTKFIYEEIYEIVQSNTNTDDRIFAFPHIPIIYTLTGRDDPGTFTKVQWFDVSTDLNVTRDINVILENPPKIIIMYNLPPDVIKRHEELFNNNSVQSGFTNMEKSLKEIIIPGDYTLYRTLIIDANNSISIFHRNW